MVENIARLVKAKERAMAKTRHRGSCEGNAGEADMEDGVCRACQKTGEACKEVEVELKEYEEHPVGIHMSLGLVRPFSALTHVVRVLGIS